MAASIDVKQVVGMEPYVTIQLNLSSLTSDLVENIAHGGPSGCTVTRASFEVIQKPTDGSDLSMEHKVASDSTTNNTVALRFYTEPGGSLSGAKVKVFLTFHDFATGGITASVSP